MAGMDKARWMRVSAQLDELLEADAAQRSARLAQLRADNPALADDVSALLAPQAEIETADFLGGSPFWSEPDETLVGKPIGACALERALGAGGMGTVWLARRSDGRDEGRAAVKFLNLALLGRGGAERFRREGSALARLMHPNVAHLIDAGLAAGYAYLVLEYVDGAPIDRWRDGWRLDWLRVFASPCRSWPLFRMRTANSSCIVISSLRVSSSRRTGRSSCSTSA